jgi:hypothetical protein
VRDLFPALAALAAGRAAGMARIPVSFAHLLLALLALLGVSLLPVLFWPARPEGLGAPLAWAAGGYVTTGLLPLALALFLSVVWGRVRQWPRFAIAFAWIWTLLGLLIFVLPAVLDAMFLPGRSASGSNPAATVFGFTFYAAGACYVAWLNWFLLRHGLGVSAIKALLTLVVIAIVPVWVDGMRYARFESPMVHTIFKN